MVPFRKHSSFAGPEKHRMEHWSGMGLWERACSIASSALISSAAQVVCKRIHSAQRQTAKTSLECLRHPGCLALPELYKAPRSTGMWRRSNIFSCCLHSLFHFMKRIATVLCKTAQPYFSDRSYQCYHCLHRKEQIEKVFCLSLGHASTPRLNLMAMLHSMK